MSHHPENQPHDPKLKNLAAFTATAWLFKIARRIDLARHLGLEEGIVRRPYQGALEMERSREIDASGGSGILYVASVDRCRKGLVNSGPKKHSTY